MITKTEAERLAQSTHALRPDWPVAQLMTLLAATHDSNGEYLPLPLRDYPLRDLGCALTWLALDTDHEGNYTTRSPYRILEQGPWWSDTREALELAKARARDIAEARSRLAGQIAERRALQRVRSEGFEPDPEVVQAIRSHKEAARQAIFEARNKPKESA